MHTTDDSAPLHDFASQGSAQSLDELVREHLPMVHAAALRQVRDPHLAEDVTQGVFLELMRSSKRLSRRVVIAGWLFNTTRYVAFKTLRARSRRAKHEKQAAAMTRTDDANPPAMTERFGGLLDEAMASLPGRDRDAIVLRYLQGKSCREVGEAQQITEEAARQRVFRALQRLRKQFSRRGLAISEEMLGASLVAAAIHAPPTHLVSRVLSAMRAPIAGSISLTTILSRLMFMISTQKIASAFIALLLVGGASSALMHFAWSAPAAAPAASAARFAPGSTPLVTLINAFAAADAGDADGMISCFSEVPPESEKALRTMVAGISFGNRLRDAIAARFGQPEADKLTMIVGFIPSMTPATVKQSKVTITGDKAIMKVPYMGNMRFVRSGEVWKFAPDMVGNEANAPVFARIEPHIPEFEPVIADIRAGKYATIHDLRIKLNRMATAINNEALPPLDLPARPKVLRPSTRPTETIAASFWAHATGDAAAALSCWKDRTPEQIASIRQSAKNAKIGANLFDAISANFGRREATNTMLMLGLELGLTGTLLEKAPVTENGDTAHVDLRPSGIDHADLVKQNGVWLLATRHDKLPPAAWGERIDTYYFPAYAQLARDIDAGKFETAGEVQRIVKNLNGEMQTEYKKMAATTKKAQ